MKIYLAGPISGQSFDGVIDSINDRKKPLIEMGYEVLHPMMGKGHLRTELSFKKKDYRHPVSTNHAIFERDKWMVQQADIVFANLLPANGVVSIGTMFELAWASHTGKHTVVVLEEGNIHEHAFVFEAADILFTSLHDALSYLENLSRGTDHPEGGEG